MNFENCKGCNVECPFVVPVQCPIRAMLEKRIEQMNKGLKQINQETEGTIMVLNSISFGRN